MINWKKTANSYQKDYLNDLKQLIAIDSERDDAHRSEQYPLGPGPAKALKKYLEFGKRDGFKTENLDNTVGYIEYGIGNQTMAIQAHADVMPAGNGWKTNPFKMIEKNGNIYGRGTSDDKGPGLAAYYGLKMLKDHGIKPHCKIRFIIGTDEESDWTGMKHYFDVEPAPNFGFSPDAEFPLINGEKGISSFQIKFGRGGNDNSQLISFHSGLRDNMVPAEATAAVKSNDFKSLSDQFSKFLDHNPIHGETKNDNGQIQFKVNGKAAHGMAPQNGVNAGTYLAKFLNQYVNDNSNFLDFITKFLHLDFLGQHLNLNHHDDTMGDLTINPGIMNFDVKNGGLIVVNIRYPKGIDIQTINSRLNQYANNNAVVKLDNMNPHYVDPKDPVVTKLMHAYRTQTGRNDQPKVVGGGTYARMMSRGVAFGALCSWKTPSTMHQPNEFQPISDLMLAMSIYGQSIYELTK
ncbi:dipeptidase PepV [Philodulcilactobacillus myokoensis]|uniref:Dipeptidase PepV n=1 Tax=Philodulcilactobacillus myokoensis TaxID=2929573 RepID=A0A9W6B0T9_9LACO|nr:dipeptidase PepV [Philodulcilactobacillus myokoensis]GLB46722.1 dipeptidase PepV [Philodulcilactobacillus myokoensis]